MTKRINLLFYFFFFGISCFGAADTTYVVANDTLHIQERFIDQAELRKFKADSEFRYGKSPEGMSPWQRFTIWAISMLTQILSYATQTLLGKIVFYALLIFFLLWVVLKLLNIDAKDLFYGSNVSPNINYEVAEKNIHAFDFEKLIESAVQKNEYRDAVRLTFLYALKKLSNSQVINWMPGKTNDDYLREVKSHTSSPRLQELRYYFDYAWYGHFEISENTYKEVKQSFQELNSTLR